jgi:hypothetical protein
VFRCRAPALDSQRQVPGSRPKRALAKRSRIWHCRMTGHSMRKQFQSTFSNTKSRKSRQTIISAYDSKQKLQDPQTHSNEEAGLHSPSSWVRLDWRCKTFVTFAVCCVGDVGDWDGEPSSASWLRVSASASHPGSSTTRFIAYCRCYRLTVTFHGFRRLFVLQSAVMGKRGVSAQ